MKYFILIFFIISCLTSCKSKIEINYYDFDSDNLIKFQDLLKKRKHLTAVQDLISWSNNIKRLFIDKGKNNELLQFYGELAFKENDPKIKALMYFILSDIYWQMGLNELSVFYMLKIDETEYSVEYYYNPLGYYIAKRIITERGPFVLKEKMYKILLGKYENLIDLPVTLNELVNIYREELEIEKTKEVINLIIRNFEKKSEKNNEINDDINFFNLKKELFFYNIGKQWVSSDLEYLINTIKNAIRTKNSKLLERINSKSDFIIKTFQDGTFQQNWTYEELDIQKMWNNNIVFSDKLEDYSNYYEAYLRTDNWDFSDIKTWYFYFKRIYYPYDYKIHGCWEWAGIYFGSP